MAVSSRWVRALRGCASPRYTTSSRAPSNWAMARSASKMLLRWTSVGWAVSTGETKLADLRYSGIQNETVIQSVPAIVTIDPMAQVYLSYGGYFDGTTLQIAPVLPQDMIRPYQLTERPHGTTQLFTVMDPLMWAIPRVPKASWNRQWLWRGDKLYMPGALVVTDIAMSYAQLLADFVDGTTPWFQQPVPIMNCLDSLADYVCREICVARGQADAAAAFQLSAEANARLIINRDTAQGKSVQKVSELGRMADAYTPDNDPEPIKR